MSYNCERANLIFALSDLLFVQFSQHVFSTASLTIDRLVHSKIFIFLASSCLFDVINVRILKRTFPIPAIDWDFPKVLKFFDSIRWVLEVPESPYFASSKHTFSSDKQEIFQYFQRIFSCSLQCLTYRKTLNSQVIW